jgi:hypothetical protein
MILSCLLSAFVSAAPVGKDLAPPAPKDLYFHVFQGNMVSDNIQCFQGSNDCMPPEQVWIKENGSKYEFGDGKEFSCTDLCKTQHASSLACESGFSCKINLQSSSFTVHPGAKPEPVAHW